MKGFWCVYMKDGREMTFGRRVHFIDSADGVIYFMTDQRSRMSVAAIPIENILWMKFVEEEAISNLRDY